VTGVTACCCDPKL
jgi:hypothetical protein